MGLTDKRNVRPELRSEKVRERKRRKKERKKRERKKKDRKEVRERGAVRGTNQRLNRKAN